MKGRLALITGATSGIGEATAVALAEAGSELILVGRRSERLLNLKIRLQESVGAQVTLLTLDIRDRAACEKAFLGLQETLERVDILVNNAGLAKGIDSMPNAAIDDWEVMIDTNIKGLLYVTRAVLPTMMKRGRGDIVNLGSVAGRWTYPGGGVYCATKAAVLALTEGLRMDVKGTGVRVVNIEPGMVETEFSEVRLGTAEKARQVYEGMTPLSARDIAETIVWCINRPAHVNVQELVIFPTDQAGVGYVNRR